MQTWEYLIIYMGDNPEKKYEPRFNVRSSVGAYLDENEYKSIDPKGKKVAQHEKWYWAPGMTSTEFLIVLLKKLGAEGWEMIGNIQSGYYTSVECEHQSFSNEQEGCAMSLSSSCVFSVIMPSRIQLLLAQCGHNQPLVLPYKIKVDLL